MLPLIIQMKRLPQWFAILASKVWHKIVGVDIRERVLKGNSERAPGALRVILVAEMKIERFHESAALRVWLNLEHNIWKRAPNFVKGLLDLLCHS
jgi:hypothetical protein